MNLSLPRPAYVMLLALAVAQTAIAEMPAATPAPQSTPTQLVDALNGVFGQHKGARAVHAKGIVLEGTFTPSAGAKNISKAQHFKGGAVPVDIRFSAFAGIPDIPDNHSLAAPRGMAIKFHLQDGSQTDIVSHSFNGFPTPTADDFRELLTAIGTSGPDAAKPTPLDNYLGGHPIAKAFLTAPKPFPASYGTLPFFGVNTFKFTNAKRAVTYGRYQIVPLEGSQYLSDADAAKAAPDFLASEIGQRLAHGPVKFGLMLQIADSGDKLDDPSIAWPESRRTVELGTISITKLAADNDAAQRRLLFIPNALPAGIEVQDPMVNARSNAYAVSFGRRQQ